MMLYIAKGLTTYLPSDVIDLDTVKILFIKNIILGSSLLYTTPAFFMLKVGS